MLYHSQLLDRFIPNTCNHINQSHSIHKSSSSIYQNYIKKNLCPQSRIVKYHKQQTQPSTNIITHSLSQKSLKFWMDPNYHHQQLQKYHYQKIQNLSEAEKILDVPGFRDDFYLNVLDWSPYGPLGIGLDNQAYLYTPSNIIQLCKVIDLNYISSIRFWDLSVCIGLSNGKIQIYDIEQRSLIREIRAHEKRVSALAFCSKNLMYSGSKDKNILVNDVRIKDSIVNKLSGHRGQVCSLQCQPQLQNVLASGSNDNYVGIWDLRNHQLSRKYVKHKGAVKAISWCPWKTGVIATAGGAGDRTIRLWNINESQDLCVNKTQTQISSLQWNEQLGSLISAHGHPQNEINFWTPQLISNRTFFLQKTKTLIGHSGRILNLSISPSNSMICSLSADQTLRFWKLFQSNHDPWKSQTFSKDCRWSLKLK